MSHVCILAADKKLPLCSRQEMRTVQSRNTAITFQQGFQLEELIYYHQAVADLNYPMKPFLYELSLEENELDLRNFRRYCAENFSQGETLELWSVWVGDVNQKIPPHYRGTFQDFDMEALKQFLSAKEICLTITM